MSKATNQPKPQRPHTADEMHLALSRLASVKQHLHGNRDDDDPEEVLQSVIDEVLKLRESVAGVTLYMQQWLAENTRR